MAHLQRMLGLSASSLSNQAAAKVRFQFWHKRCLQTTDVATSAAAQCISRRKCMLHQQRLKNQARQSPPIKTFECGVQTANLIAGTRYNVIIFLNRVFVSPSISSAGTRANRRDKSFQMARITVDQNFADFVARRSCTRKLSALSIWSQSPAT